MGGVAGYWRGGGHDEPGESERPERPEQEGERRPRLGEIDENTISDKELLSFFGVKSWDELDRARSEQLDPDEYEPPGQPQEPGSADEPVETDQQPEQTRLWRTIAEETGEVKSYPSYSAARRDLGSVPDTELHHVVEQCQGMPERTGFSVEQINTTDNIARIPTEVHRKVSGHYGRHIPGTTETLRNSLNGTPWEYQTEVGRDVLDTFMTRHIEGHGEDR